MLAVIACILFILAAFGLTSLGPIGVVALGLAFLAAHLALPVLGSFRR